MTKEEKEASISKLERVIEDIKADKVCTFSYDSMYPVNVEDNKEGEYPKINRKGCSLVRSFTVVDNIG